MKHRSPTSGAVGLLYPCGRIFISNISNSTKQRNCWGSIRRFDTISSYVPMYQREIMSRDCHVTTHGTVRSWDRCGCHVHCLIRLLTSRSLVSNDHSFFKRSLVFKLIPTLTSSSLVGFVSSRRRSRNLPASHHTPLITVFHFS